MSDPHPPIDLGAYFGRIGYGGGSGGGRAPTMATLAGIVRRHAETIPFENLGPLLGEPVRLDLASLQDKLVRRGRGGYCFEHNTLLKHALEALGFRVTGLAARVVWNAPPGAVTPRAHMLLRVELPEGPHLVDVGFGGQTLTGVLRLEPGLEQPTPLEPFRLTADGGELVMESQVAGEWRPLYRFDLTPQHPVDYEVANHFTATHPGSIFLNTLFFARPAADRRFALMGDQLAVHPLGGTTERRTLHGVAEARAVLERDFQVALPDAPDLDAVLARFVG